MQRSWLWILTISMLLTLVSADVAFAKKKSRSSRASTMQARRNTHHGSGGQSLSRREKRGRRGHLARSRRHHRRRYQSQDPIASGGSRPQPGIPPERVTEIQQALVKAGYLDTSSGQYDDATTQAMKEFQAGNGLPRTGLPSAPSLKKLGVPKRSNDSYAVPVTTVSK